MRWFWIDRFIEFESGSHARAVKNVTLAEEHLHDHFPGFAVMPASLMVEGMAQTGGILLGEKNNFRHIVILAKVPKVEFHGWVSPGETIVYTAKLLEDREEGGSVQCVAHVGERLVAEADIMFVHLDQNDQELGAIDQKNFVFSMNLLSILDVGKAGDGTTPSSAAE
ncbi:MAG: 3-hydroxyacyl-ACP dehydratase FabZ family protein [Planctomycetaceae bacterium]